MKRYCLSTDLKDDPELMAEYERWHESHRIWPEIVQSIRNAGILNMEIFRTGNRLFMIMETEDDFTFERKTGMDAGNEKVREWEDLMWKYQQPLPWAKPGEKWTLMEQIFSLPG